MVGYISCSIDMNQGWSYDLLSLGILRDMTLVKALSMLVRWCLITWAPLLIMGSASLKQLLLFHSGSQNETHSAEMCLTRSSQPTLTTLNLKRNCSRQLAELGVRIKGLLLKTTGFGGNLLCSINCSQSCLIYHSLRKIFQDLKTVTCSQHLSLL